MRLEIRVLVAVICTIGALLIFVLYMCVISMLFVILHISLQCSPQNFKERETVTQGAQEWLLGVCRGVVQSHYQTVLIFEMQNGATSLDTINCSFKNTVAAAYSQLLFSLARLLKPEQYFGGIYYFRIESSDFHLVDKLPPNNTPSPLQQKLLQNN